MWKIYYVVRTVTCNVGCMANSVDPDESLCSAASDLGLNCLLKL